MINAMVYHAEFGLVDSPARPDEFEMLPGVATAVKQIHDLGFLAIVISNQPGIAKGKYTPELFEATTAKMHAELAAGGAGLDDVFYCLHHPNAALDAYRTVCDCRKPRPGMLLEAAQKWDIDLDASYFVGDGITDVQAGAAAGVTTLLVNARKCYICDELARKAVEPDFVVKDVGTAVAVIAALQGVGDADVEAARFRCGLVEAER